MSKSPKSPKTESEAEAPVAAAKPAKTPKARKSAEDAADFSDEPAAKASPADAALLKRLPEMTDFQLRAHHMSTARISRDTAHAKSGAAKSALVLIEAEIARRTVSPDRAPSPTREAVASPKMGAKKRGD
jgi:hypothetical protein